MIMPAILNCLDEEQTLKVAGMYYTFKPNQLKYFHDKGIAGLMARNHAEDGVVLVDESLEHLSHLKADMLEKVISAEEKAKLEAHKEAGIANYVKRLRELIFNATVSLQKDIDISGAKYDARVLATDADLERFEKLAKYQKTKSDNDQAKVDRIKELEKQLGVGIKGK